MKVYVASSWRNQVQPLAVQHLRALGHQVYDFREPIPGGKGFGWSEIDPNWQQWSTADFARALEHPIAQVGFRHDFGAMRAADACVLVLPCGRSAHAEAGWMAGAGKRVYVYQPEPQEPELMYRLFNGISGGLDEIGSWLARDVEPAPSPPCPRCGEWPAHGVCPDRSVA